MADSGAGIDDGAAGRRRRASRTTRPSRRRQLQVSSRSQTREKELERDARAATPSRFRASLSTIERLSEGRKAYRKLRDNAQRARHKEACERSNLGGHLEVTDSALSRRRMQHTRTDYPNGISYGSSTSLLICDSLMRLRYADLRWEMWNRLGWSQKTNSLHTKRPGARTCATYNTVV